MKRMSLLLLMSLIAGAAGAQTIYRCGSSFSPHPCGVQPADAGDTRPMLRDNETVEQFAERQVRYLEEKSRFNGSGSGVATRAPAPAKARSGS